jgi:hypothetical protein
VNQFKGVADVKFKIKGTEGDASVIFKGKRKILNGDVWESKVFEVTKVAGETGVGTTISYE